mmetsp:Transcript_3396/g.11408  ORF Transcript_3396/g.11408 Transcript_3396/m.11408 type:complete len:230 (-) Transcript_3396:42-731(-)
MSAAIAPLPAPATSCSSGTAGSPRSSKMALRVDWVAAAEKTSSSSRTMRTCFNCAKSAANTSCARHQCVAKASTCSGLSAALPPPCRAAHAAVAYATAIGWRTMMRWYELGHSACRKRVRSRLDGDFSRRTFAGSAVGSQCGAQAASSCAADSGVARGWLSVMWESGLCAITPAPPSASSTGYTHWTCCPSSSSSAGMPKMRWPLTAGWALTRPASRDVPERCTPPTNT